MAVTLNAKGTSVSSFTIGKGGQAITLNANGYLTIDDGVDTEQPIGYNTIPIYEIDVADTFDLAHAGMMWHKDSGAAVTFTCDNDSTIPQGSTWMVHNDDTENLTIAEGTGVTIAFLASGAAPATGNVTVEQGGIVTVYKYTDTEYWVWGDDAPFDLLTAGATTDSTLRWNGTSWAEETQVRISSAGVLTILDSGLTDSVAFSHDGTDFNIAGTATTDINVTGISGFNVVNYNFDVDQTVGAVQNGYVLRYDNGTGLISLRPSGGGATVSGVWQYDNTTTEANPGAGNFRTDNNTIGSVTEVFINKEDKDGGDFDVLLAALGAGDALYLQNVEDATEYLLFDITANVDNTDWFSIAGTVNDSSASFTDGKEFGILLLYGGTSPGNVSNTGTPLNNQIAVWTDATTIEGDANLTWDGSTLTASALSLTTALGETDGGTGTDTYAVGDILYSDAVNSLAKLTAGSDGQVLTLASGVPSWAAAGGGNSQILTDTFTFSTTITAPPGNNEIRYNSGTLASVSNIFVDDDALSGNDFGLIAAQLEEGDRIIIASETDATVFNEFVIRTALTDNTGYWTVPVDYIGGTGTLPTNAATIRFEAYFTMIDPGTSTGNAHDIPLWTGDRWQASGANIRINDANPPIGGRIVSVGGASTDVTRAAGMYYDVGNSVSGLWFAEEATSADGFYSFADFNGTPEWVEWGSRQSSVNQRIFYMDDNNALVVDSAASLMLEEKAAANADVAGRGQIWVANTTPNDLYFTDDAGNDYALTGPESPSADSATVQTTNATQTEILAYSIATGTSVGFEALIMGREDATGDTVLEKIRGLISNEAGTTALIDTPGVDRHESAGASAWVVTVAADDTGDTLTFDVTGEAAHTIDWKIKLEVIVI